ncbi:unnamed protein product [Gordionus sp. m RMFG-2023]
MGEEMLRTKENPFILKNRQLEDIQNLRVKFDDNLNSLYAVKSDSTTMIRDIPSMKAADEDISMNLDNYELWKKFNDFGTEMIITKSGR